MNFKTLSPTHLCLRYKLVFVFFLKAEVLMRFMLKIPFLDFFFPLDWLMWIAFDIHLLADNFKDYTDLGRHSLFSEF